MEPEAPVVEEKDTLDQSITETLSKTLKDIQSRPAEGEAPPVDAEATVPDKPIASDRARAEDGKFIKADDKPAPKDPAAPAAKPDKAQIAGAIEQAAAEPDKPIVTTTGQPIDINRPPSSWKPAAKVAYATLDPAIKTEIHRREADFLNGGKGLKENADFGGEIKGILAPYRALLDAEGGTPQQAIQNYLRTAAVLRQGTPQQKLQAVFGLDQTFNLGLQQHFNSKVQEEVAKRTGGQPQAGDGTQPQAPTQQQPPVFQDPRVDHILAAYQRQEQERTAQDKAVRDAATTQFLSAKDEKGQPKYQFVDNVLDEMSVRVSAIRAANPALGHEQVLERAYEEAVWANPETRAVLIGQQQAQAQQPADNLRKVEQARRANAVNVPKRGAIPHAKPTGKFNSPEADEAMRETLRQLNG